MSDVRQLTPAACILVTLPYRSATVWSATKVVLYCRKSKSFTPEVEPGSLEIINGQLDKFFASYTRTV